MVRTAWSMKKRRANGQFATRRRSLYRGSIGVIPRGVANSQFGNVLNVTLRQRLLGSSYLTSSGGGILAQQVFVNDPSGAQDWTSFSSTFDNYRVNAVSIQFLPTFTQDQLGSTPLFKPLYIVYDSDGVNPGSVNACLNYATMKVKNLYRSWTYKVRVAPTTDNSVATGGMMTTYDRKYGLVLDCAQVVNYHAGAISWYADTMLINTNFGDLIVSFDVTFFARR
jgi:hypothetical protein